MTNCIRILQIGDIHLPEWKASETPLDLKDSEFSSEIAKNLVQERLRNILKRVHQIASSGTIDCVAVMGDYTSYGKTAHISPAVEIIDTLVKSADGKSLPVVGVPGNHDVDKIEAATLGDSGKFKSVKEAFEKFGWAKVPVDDCVRHDVSFGPDKLAMLLINTSIGSWSKHMMPNLLAEEFTDEKLEAAPIPMITDTSMDAMPASIEESVSDEKNRSDQLFKQLDTPYLSKRALSSLSNELGQIDDRTAIVIGHHNLLPQKIPRILPYGEMLNGGTFRKFFHDANKNIVYLHGHIHDDPIECISEPRSVISGAGKYKIISVSAPKLSEGFNEVSLFFDNSNEIFLLRITKYRPNSLNLVGNFNDQETIHIPLVQNFGDLITGKSRKIWQVIKDSKTINWIEITEKFEDSDIDDKEIESAVLKLFSCNLIKVSHLGRPRKKWVIECVE